jgi:predicted dehydrogenase
MSELRVGAASFAHVHARDYARQIVEHPRAKLVVAWDEDEARGRSLCSELGIPFEADLGRFLSRDDIQGVVCSAPSIDHPRVLIAGAQAGKHLFTEKVLALTVDACDRILEAVEAAGVRLVVSMPQLCPPCIRWARLALDEGKFGDITTIRTRVGHGGAITRMFPPSSWFADPVRAGGGALMDLGCHAVYRARYLGGAPVSASAVMTNRTGAYPVEDNAVVILRLASGAMAVVEASWAQHGGPQGVAIYGTRGWALLEHPGAVVRCGGEGFTGSRMEVLEPAPLPPAWPSPIEQWVSSVLDGTEPEIRPQWGRDLTEIMQAAYLSAREGRTTAWPVL